MFLSRAPAGTPYALLIKSSSYTSHDLYRVHIRNNIFQTSGGARTLTVPASQLDGAADFELERNAYFTSGGTFTAIWNGSTYSSFGAWRSATGQETSGMLSDPQLTGPGKGGTYNDPALLRFLDAYRLKPGSPLIDRALDLTQDGVNPGGRDFFGTALPQGGGYDIGADEGSGVCGGVTLAPSSRTHGSAASTGSFAVSAPDTCGWTAVSDVAWARVRPLVGQGDATVSYSLDANAGSSSRTARITVGGATLTITQGGN